MTETVELRPAYAWTCPECGRDNFCNGIVWEGSAEEIEELRRDHGIEEHETGDWMIPPYKVHCVHCGLSSRTRHFHDWEGLA